MFGPGRHLKPVHIGQDRLAAAYALVRHAEPTICLGRWLRYGQSLVGPYVTPGRGILGLETEDGVLHGLSCYEIRDDLRHGRTLEVRAMVALDIVRSHRTEGNMIEELDRLALDLGCDAVHILTRLGHRAANVTDLPSARPQLSHRGYRAEGLLFCRPIQEEADKTSSDDDKQVGQGFKTPAAFGAKAAPSSDR